MARLARRMTAGGCRVAVQGALGVSDLRRLERACAPALDRSPAPLELNVAGLERVDEPARRFVHCLLRRGASLVGDTARQWEAFIRR